MTDFLHALNDLRRPRLLMQAARHGIQDYSRSRDLRRLMRALVTPAPGEALPALIAQEEAIEETRRMGDVSYSIVRHIEVLIAILAEARLLPRPDAGIAG